MKRVEVILSPHQLDDIVEAVSVHGARHVLVSEVKRFGPSGGMREVYRGTTYVVDFVPMVKLEFVVADDVAKDVVDELRMLDLEGRGDDGGVLIAGIDEGVLPGSARPRAAGPPLRRTFRVSS